MILRGYQLELRLWDVRLLKAKRKIVKSIIDKVHHHYKISAAEVGQNDCLSFAMIGIGLVANDTSYAETVLQKVIRSIENDYPVDLISADKYEDY